MVATLGPLWLRLFQCGAVLTQVTKHTEFSNNNCNGDLEMVAKSHYISLCQDQRTSSAGFRLKRVNDHNPTESSDSQLSSQWAGIFSIGPFDSFVTK